MPRYFFNVQDGANAADQDGVELPDIYAAQAEAIKFSGELLRDMGAKFWNETDWQMDVLDETGRILFILRVSAEETPAG